MMNNAEEMVTNEQGHETEAVNSYSGYNFKPVASKQASKIAGIPSAISIVNTANHGKRITLSGGLVERIGSPEAVQIAVNEEGIVVGAELPNNETYFTLKQIGRKGVVYSSELVEELTSLFNLDFNDRSSVSFYDVTYLTLDDAEVAFVPFRK